MARPSRTGGKTRRAKTGKGSSPKGRKSGKAKRRIGSAAKPPSVAAGPRRPNDHYSELKEAREQQAATAEILKVIASSPDDVQPVFAAIAASANGLLGGYSTSVLRFIDGFTHLAAFTPTTPEADEILRATFPVPSSEIPFVARLATGATVQITDTETDVNPRSARLGRARGYRSILLAPLMSVGTAIGFIGVSRREAGPFADHHVNLLQTFADQAVIAIENARLFNEVQAKTRDLEESLQQQTATADVLKVISRSAFDLQTVLETLVRSAVELSGAMRGTIYLRDGDVLRFRAASYEDINPAWLDFLKDNPQRAGRHSAVGRAIASGQTICVPDLLADPEIKIPANALAGIRAVLATPLLRDGRVEGVMVLSRQTPGPFTERQTELVQTFADQAVIAIENARLFEVVQARTRDLTESLQQQTVTADVLKVISRSAFDLDSVMNTLTRSAAELCKAELSALYLREGDLMIARGMAGVDETRMDFLRDTPLQTDQSGAGRALLTGSILNMADVEHVGTDTTRKFGKTLGFNSILFVPLMREGRGIGVFALGRERTGKYSEREVELLQTFADQAVIAIENARLFEEVQAKTRDLQEALEQQTATAEVLGVISSSAGDLAPVFDAMLGKAMQLCSADFGVLNTYDGKAFHTAATYALPPAYDEFRRRQPLE